MQREQLGQEGGSKDLKHACCVATLRTRLFRQNFEHLASVSIERHTIRRPCLLWLLSTAHISSLRKFDPVFPYIDA